MSYMGRWRIRGEWWKLINTLSIQPNLRFYEIMGYPIPFDAELYFQYSSTQKSKKNLNKNVSSRHFSRDKKSQYLDEYLQEIQRLKTTFQSIPFVEQIFLCNSISFNALDENSDIDLFIIAKPWRIWSVKFWSMVLFTLKWAKRFWKKIRKKICLSFFVTSDAQNLYPISLPSLDVYLAYWIAHLVLIYQPDNQVNNSFFQSNKRVKWILPNYQEKQTISLWINPFSWNTKFKNVVETLGDWFLWNIFEQTVKLIQKAIINLKRIRNPAWNKDVIISDSMLKFHQDIREKVSLKYNIKVK